MVWPKCGKRIVRGLVEMAATLPLTAPGKPRSDERRARQWIKDMAAWYAAKPRGPKMPKADHNEQG